MRIGPPAGLVVGNTFLRAISSSVRLPRMAFSPFGVLRAGTSSAMTSPIRHKTFFKR